jgi:3-hydroxyisobutyrate dehydrogenase-like beta-hydroxyacid dehydrogenase
MTQGESIGFIGLGVMGSGMARNLLSAGYAVTALDLDPARTAAIAEAGATVGESVSQVLANCDVIATSLPDSAAWVALADAQLVPGAREGQLFVDFGTVEPSDVERFAAELAGKGAALVDAPVSGGAGGAADGTLRVFVGGEQADVERAMPILWVVGDPEQLHHCGSSGAGQRAKLVNQMAMGLHAAALLETVAFGVGAGLTADQIATAVGGDVGWRGMLASMARRVAAGEGEHQGVKVLQLPYILREADGRFPLPLTEALYNFCGQGEIVTTEANRPSPSFWHELRRGATRDTDRDA